MFKSGEHRIIMGSDNARTGEMGAFNKAGTLGPLVGHCASLGTHWTLITEMQNAPLIGPRRGWPPKRNLTHPVYGAQRCPVET